MMNKEKIFYEDQYSNDLNLTLADDEIDLNQFTILETAKAVKGGIMVVARIIGGSHIINYRLKGLDLYEIFACSTVSVPSMIIHSGPLGKALTQLHLEFPGNILYDFRNSKIPWDKGKDRILRLQQIVAQQSQPVALSYTFPKGNSLREPQTIVVVKIEAGKIMVESLHSYPNEEVLVFTESTLTYGG